jgi:hypothetical protein
MWNLKWKVRENGGFQKLKKVGGREGEIVSRKEWCNYQ